MDEWGPALRRRRQALDVSQSALARAVGVSEAKMCRWELGRTRPPGQALRNKVEAALDQLSAPVPEGRRRAVGLGARIRAARVARNWAQADVAKRIGQSEATVSEWEREASLPGTLSLLALAETLEVSADWLLGLSDTQELSKRSAKNRIGRKEESV